MEISQERKEAKREAAPWNINKKIAECEVKRLKTYSLMFLKELLLLETNEQLVKGINYFKLWVFN